MGDNKYAETFGIPMKAGRFFAAQFNDANATEIVINQTQAKALGWDDPEKAIGQSTRIIGFSAPFTIVGVTADFHFGSMQERIPPVTFLNVNYTTFYRYLSFKLKPGDMEKSVSALQDKWASLLPGTPFDYNFMDTALEALYKTEIRLKKASVIATTLAIIIAFLGVVGLVSQSIQRRNREIGIRKVLGSSVEAIIGLFMREFLIIVSVAVLAASPLAYLLMQSWLKGYVYKIAISVSPFAISVGILGIVTALLVVLLTIKAALANPVKSLRSE
jgi:putative ABC transport system permease protein